MSEAPEAHHEDKLDGNCWNELEAGYRNKFRAHYRNKVEPHNPNRNELEACFWNRHKKSCENELPEAR